MLGGRIFSHHFIKHSESHAGTILGSTSLECISYSWLVFSCRQLTGLFNRYMRLCFHFLLFRVVKLIGLICGVFKTLQGTFASAKEVGALGVERPPVSPD